MLSWEHLRLIYFFLGLPVYGLNRSHFWSIKSSHPCFSGFIWFGLFVFRRRILSFLLIRIFPIPYGFNYFWYKNYIEYNKLLDTQNAASKINLNMIDASSLLNPNPYVTILHLPKVLSYPDLYNFHFFAWLYNDHICQTLSCFIWKVVKLYVNHFFCILLFAF